MSDKVKIRREGPAFSRAAVRIVLAVCFLLVSGGIFPAGRQPVYGAALSDGDERVFDQAGLFDSREVSMLEERVSRLRDEMKAEVVILTVEDAKGRTSQYTADQFYFDNGFSETFHENGILMLIDLDNRELYLGTYGSMIRILTDERIEKILDEVYAAAAEGEYASAALAGVEKAGEYFTQGIVKGQYNYDVETGKISVHRSIRWYEAVFAVLASGFVAWGVCRGVVRSYRMKDSTSEADKLAYRSDCNFRYRNPADRLVNTMVTHMVIPRQQSPGGRGGGFSSSGRSSTHSYGGHQAGGGGRKF